MNRSEIQIIKQPNNDFKVSLFSQGKDKDFAFFVHLIHLHSNESYIIEVKESVQVVAKDNSFFALSPVNLCNNILKNHKKCMQVTKDAEVVLILQYFGESVSVCLPAPRKDESRNIGTEVRFKKLQQTFLERIDELNQRCMKAEHYCKQVEERLQAMNLQLQNMKGKTEKASNNISDKDYVDPQTLQILNGLTLQSQNSSIDALKADMEKQISELSDRNNRIQQETKSQLGRMHEELNSKIQRQSVVLERQENVFMNFQRIEKEVTSSVFNIAHSLYTSDACSQSMIVRRQGVRLSNKSTQQSYNYFFSKFVFPPQSVTTLSLQTKKEEVLFGFCDRPCLESVKIFLQEGAFFFTFEEKMYIAGQHLQKKSNNVEEELKTIIMTVDLNAWAVSWQIEGIKQSFVKEKIPTKLREREFHPTVLMNLDDPADEVVLSFA